MNPIQSQRTNFMSRREMLKTSGLGLGSLALAALIQTESSAAAGGRFDLTPKPAHFAPQAKSVILLMQNGGPSPMDLFDPKPKLNQMAGKTYTGKVEAFQTGNSDKLLGNPFKFAKHGTCGMDFADVLPHLAGVADELCMVRSMQSEHNNHSEALILFNTGKIFQGRPALGSWVCYGLGSENQNLPSYVVLRDPAATTPAARCCGRTAGCRRCFGGRKSAPRGRRSLICDPASPARTACRSAAWGYWPN